MSTPSSGPPPPVPESNAPTQIVGQESGPSTAVPVGGAASSTSIQVGGRRINTLAVVSLVTAIVAPFGHVTGIGGLFFRARDPSALGRWYQENLGVTLTPTSYDVPPWRQEAGPTVFAPFP